MNRIFSEISENFEHYGAQVLSSPILKSGKPWVVSFDKFLTDAEVEAFLATNHNFTRSTEVDTSYFGQVTSTAPILILKR